MAEYPRYAIYYAAAQDSELHRFGAHLLGYDAYTGDDLPFPDGVAREVPDWQDLTHDPRKYGFHATLKAPMALRDRKAEAELFAACASFASKPRHIPVITPVVDSISGFIAVVPAERSIELEQLAAECVSDLDCFRAPLTVEQRTRRNPSQLTPRQCEYLDRWGYPYVMEDFRFHMTLTGRLDLKRREPILGMLRKRFSESCIKTAAVDTIGLFRQDHVRSRFRIVGHWKLHQ